MPGAGQDRREGAWGFDLSAACSGFPYALQVGAKLVESGAHKKVLVIGADVMRSIIDYTDRATCIIFGDGAGAVLLEPCEEGEIGLIDFFHEVDGSGAAVLNMPAGGVLLPATHETVDNEAALSSTRTGRRCTSLRCARWRRLRRRCWRAMA